MRQYKDIPIWENLRRTELLIEFKNLVEEYCNKVIYYDSYVSNEPVKNEEVQQIRSKINNILHEVHSTILASGIAPNIYYSPPPAIGGIAGWIGVVNNIFNLHSLEIDHRHLIDFIERSIGIYKRDKIKAFLRTINPFYWIVLLLDFIVSIPFKILGKLGFNQEKLESSFFGKLIKGVLYLVTVFAAFLTILEKLGYLEWFKKLIFK